MNNDINLLMLSWRFARSPPSLENSLAKKLFYKGYLKKLLTKGGRLYTDDLKKSHLRWRIYNFLYGNFNLRLNPPKNRKSAMQSYLDNIGSNLLDGCNVVYTGINAFPQTLKKAKTINVPTVISHLVNNPLETKKQLDKEYDKFPFSDKYHEPLKLNKEEFLSDRLESLNLADLILVGSTTTLKSNIKAGIPKEKMKIIPAGIDLSSFVQTDYGGNIFRVICVGHGVLSRGIPYLVEAWNRLSFKKSELVIIGDMDHKFVSKFKNNNSIRFTGSVSSLEVNNYLTSSSLMVHPAICDSGPRSVLEGMASGLPVIISNMSGYSELLTNGKEGFVVPAFDIDALESKIKYFYQNKDKIKTMGKCALDTVQNYSLDTYSSSVIKCIEDVLMINK